MSKWKIKQGSGHDGQCAFTSPVAVFLLKSEKAAISPVAIT